MTKPQQVKQDKADNLITVDHSTNKNKDIEATARRRLFETAGELTSLLPGYKHSGSYAVHFFFSDLTGPSYLIQLELDGTTEYVGAMAFNELYTRLQKYHGHEVATKK